MGLLQKLKAALGLDGTQSPDTGTAGPGDVDVTVEREPSSESEDAVTGAETASAGAVSSDEPDAAVTDADEPSPVDEPIVEAEESTETGTADDATAQEETAEVDTDVVTEEATDDAESTEDGTVETGSAEDDSPDTEPAEDGSTDPVTEISGIGPAYGQRLADAGVETVADLAAADADELEAATDISASRIEGWIDAAGEY